jgi:hypothetical protein
LDIYDLEKEFGVTLKNGRYFLDISVYWGFYDDSNNIELFEYSLEFFVERDWYEEPDEPDEPYEPDEPEVPDTYDTDPWFYFSYFSVYYDVPSGEYELLINSCGGEQGDIYPNRCEFNLLKDGISISNVEKIFSMGDVIYYNVNSLFDT